MKKLLIERLRKLGFSEKIVSAFEKVPREMFVPEDFKDYAYHDTALPIGYGQTISQPYTIAVMLEMLRLEEGYKVLEIGTGSGYTAALIYEITHAPVYTIEIISRLAEEAGKRLKRLGYKDVYVFCKDGKMGLPEYAPYDRIIIHAATPEIPEALVRQLKENGVLVAPVGPKDYQDLVAYRKNGSTLKEVERREGFIFVPLV